MKTLTSLFLIFVLISCTSNAQQTLSIQTFELAGDSLPAIRHMTDMKISGDTLYFVYETEDGFGQRFLRSAIIDHKNAKLNIRPEIGKGKDGYYQTYMPAPFFDVHGNVHVVNQDDGEIYDLSDCKTLTRTKTHLVSDNSKVPFPMAQYFQDVSMISPDNYAFIGREPNGGSQYAMKVNTSIAIVDTIRKIAISPELQSWMPNAGELICSGKFNRVAFAYRLHPVIDIFDMDGNMIKQVRIAPDTFDREVLQEADFEELTPLYFVDVTTTHDYIYALYWGCKYSNIQSSTPYILKIDWNGNIVAKFPISKSPLYRIAVSIDGAIIGWDGKTFVNIDL